MARKRNSDGGGVSLDSLMDALTNVVAVLILVLLLVSADVKQKVEQFFDDLEPATPQQIEESKKKIEELEKEQQKLDQLLTEEPPSPEDLEEEKRKLALLEKTIEDTEKKNRELLANLDQLKKLEAEKRKQRDKEEKKTVFMQEEIARLESLLDETPVLNIPATEVSIPVSRPVPKSSETYYAIVTQDRVHFIDPFTPVETLEDQIKKNDRKWLIERVKRGNDRIKIYDQAQMAEYFNTFDFKNTRKQQVKIITNPISTRISMNIVPDLKEGGTHIDELSGKTNTFVSILSKLRNNKKAVLFFLVDTKSFNTYLQARSLADKAGIAAGWKMEHMDFDTETGRGRVTPQGSFGMMLKEVEVNRLKDPPPPKPKPKPKNPPKKEPKPAGPPKIGPKLD
tara:strand:+ start:5660 stop:6847 length:1188 start_codon:yes stop_codon:yes gene_type:complete